MIFGTLLIASAAVFFSVLGLVQTFSETAYYWGTSIEVAKLVMASFLYRFWDKINYAGRALSILMIAFLMSITSLGIYGHIITSYQEGNLQVESQNIILETEELKLDRIKQKIENTNRQIEMNQNRIAAINDDIARVPDNFVTVRRELIQERRPELNRLESEIAELFDKRETFYDELSAQQQIISDTRIETGVVENKVGPIMFVVEALGATGEKAIFWFVLIIVLSFDPAAVALTVYSNKVALALESEPKEPKQPDHIDTDTPEVSESDASNEDEPRLIDAITTLSSSMEEQSKTLQELKQGQDNKKKKEEIIKNATR